MRAVVTPGALRAGQPMVLTEAQKKQWEDSQAKLKADILERREKIESDLAAAFEGLTEHRRRFIRMMVALRVPSKPMNPDDLQNWLDENCIAVARYMLTGRIK